MPDGDRAAHHVGRCPSRLSPTGPGSPSRSAQACGAPRLHVAQHLGRERFVDLDQPEIGPGEPGALERQRHRVGRPHEELPARIDRRDRVAPDVRQRRVAQRPRLLFGHEQHRRRAVGERRRVPGGDRAVLPIEDRLERGEGLEVEVSARMPLSTVTGWSIAGPANQAAISPAMRPSCAPAAARRWLMSASSSCASRVMPFSLAIFSALWPIVSPVLGSAMAGVTGTRSRGRILPNAPARSAKVFARLASMRMRLMRLECRIGMSVSVSTPPARMVSACPRAIWSAALVTAWAPEAQARFRE